jgi:hypothetical protein
MKGLLLNEACPAFGVMSGVDEMDAEDAEDAIDSENTISRAKDINFKIKTKAHSHSYSVRNERHSAQAALGMRTRPISLPQMG